MGTYHMRFEPGIQQQSTLEPLEGRYQTLFFCIFPVLTPGPGPKQNTQKEKKSLNDSMNE